MSDYRTSLEAKIDKFFEQYHSILEDRNWIDWDENGDMFLIGDGVEACRKGEVSVLNAAYDIDVDESSQCWCFRSAKEDDYNRHIGKNKIASNNIGASIHAILQKTRDAVNDYPENDEFMSYSRYMAIPLFKYHYNSELIISKLFLNTFNIEMTVNCFDWNGENGVSWDDKGNEHDRYHQECFEFPLEMKYLTSKEMLYKKMWVYLEENLSGVSRATNNDGSTGPLMDIDDVDFAIIGFTFDISEVNRNTFDNYYSSVWQEPFDGRASYRRDSEVVSTELGEPYYIIKNNNVVQLVRFLYILRIAKLSSGFDKVLEEIIVGKHSDIIELSECERKALRLISEYLTGAALIKETDIYEKR